jgi:protein tyrosine/serine phosphatase
MTSTSSVEARSRNLLLDSIDNIRDLGGLETYDGYRTREGKLYRSSAIHEVSPAEAETLASSLGLRLILDLRSHEECAGTGRGLLAQHVAAYANLPIFRFSHRSSGAVPDAGEISLFRYYIGYLEHSASQIAMAVRMLASDAHLPALFHCAAGKDRTGTLAAVLLDAVGVRHDQIIADYALTQERLDILMDRLSRTIHYSSMMQSLPAHTRDADPATMKALLEHLQEHHGGAAAWLQAAGVEKAVIERLRESMLE